MLFSKEYEIKYYEQNVNGDLKESALLNFLQDIATLSAESLGFGPTFVFSNNYAWVVLKYHIEIYKELRNLTSITIKTEPRGTSKLYAFRDFEVYTPDGKCSAKAVSTWALIDMESRRILPASKLLPMMKPYEKRDTDLEYEKIDSVCAPSYEKVFDVRFDDIDVNHHANNSNYIVWALETIPSKYRLKYTPASVDIKYKKEISLGGKVHSCTSVVHNDTGFETMHVIKDNETHDELSLLHIKWHPSGTIS